MKLSLKIPPLALGASTLLLIWLFDRFLPLHYPTSIYRNILASVVSGVGFVVALAGFVAFRRIKTTVDPRYPEKAGRLVVTGIYKYSRNPMYLGMLLAIIGYVIFLGSIPGLFICIFFVLFINRYQIQPEEMVLQDKFGEDYLDYTQKVRRWI